MIWIYLSFYRNYSWASLSIEYPDAIYVGNKYRSTDDFFAVNFECL